MNYVTLSPTLTTTIGLVGYSLNYNTQVYLSASGSIGLSGLSSFDYFSHISSLSSNNPAFSGYIWPYYNSVNNNQLFINIYGLTGSSNVDIIILNKAGYTLLSDTGNILSLILYTLSGDIYFNNQRYSYGPYGLIDTNIMFNTSMQDGLAFYISGDGYLEIF